MISNIYSFTCAEDSRCSSLCTILMPQVNYLTEQYKIPNFNLEGNTPVLNTAYAHT